MTDTQLLEGKSVLVVDDEPDILESLKELLDMCDLDIVNNFPAPKTSANTAHQTFA